LPLVNPCGVKVIVQQIIKVSHRRWGSAANYIQARCWLPSENGRSYGYHWGCSMATWGHWQKLTIPASIKHKDLTICFERHHASACLALHWAW
jgi:hypothetical protein